MQAQASNGEPLRLFRKKFLAPRFWGLWLALGLLRLIVVLPQSIRMAIGRTLALVLYRFAKDRRHTAQVNLKLCFPDLDEAAREQLLKKHFQSLGMALVEQGIAWFESDKNLKKISHIEGLEYIENAEQQGKGVILLSAHFTSLEIGNRLIMTLSGRPLYAMYQRHKHPSMENIIQYYRRKNGVRMIPENEIRQLVRKIREGKIAWYASDQGYSDHNAVLVPFFGEPASSNTALSRLATVSKAMVMPFFTIRDPKTFHYTLKILPPLENFPTGDEIEDVRIYHKVIETQANLTPEQYLWVHRRFKNRPPEYPDVYRQ